MKSCPGAEDLRTLAEAPPGQAPPELAHHLAGCPSCQARLLATDFPKRPGDGRRPNPQPQPLGALLLRAFVVLAAILLALYSVQHLLG